MGRKARIFAVTAAAIVINAASANALSGRTFVSGHGTDSGTCGSTAPCRSFAYAVTQTAAAGEITVLDSAGYGAVTLTQSITITNPGGIEAGITTASGQTAITIHTLAAANITLRGLTLEGGGAGADGMALNSILPSNSGASTLSILGCVVKDFTGNGIAVQPSVSGSGSAPSLTVTVADSVIQNNGNDGLLFAASGNVSVYPLIYRSIVSGNAAGINLTADVAFLSGILADSHVDNNATSGLTLTKVNVSPVLMVKNSTFIATGGVGLTPDITNTNGTLNLINNNTIRVLANNSMFTSTDGTNYIDAVVGTALTKVNPQ